MEDKEYKKVLREKVLSDCRTEFVFWTCLSSVIRNIYELADTMQSMNEHSFRYHVNDDNQKNDFAKWIGEVLGDNELALKLKDIRSRDEYVKIIRKRIKKLEK